MDKPEVETVNEAKEVVSEPKPSKAWIKPWEKREAAQAAELKEAAAPSRPNVQSSKGSVSDKRFCQNCGEPLLSSEAYCHKCGHKVGEPLEGRTTCINCGAPLIHPRDQYCSQCGEPQKAEAANGSIVSACVKQVHFEEDRYYHLSRVSRARKSLRGQNIFAMILGLCAIPGFIFGTDFIAKFESINLIFFVLFGLAAVSLIGLVLCCFKVKIKKGMPLMALLCMVFAILSFACVGAELYLLSLPSIPVYTTIVGEVKAVISSNGGVNGFLELAKLYWPLLSVVLITVIALFAAINILIKGIKYFVKNVKYLKTYGLEKEAK